MKIPKAATRLRKGDQLVLPRPIRVGGTLRTHAEVQRIENSEYGMKVQCAQGIWLTIRRDEMVEVVA